MLITDYTKPEYGLIIEGATSGEADKSMGILYAQMTSDYSNLRQVHRADREFRVYCGPDFEQLEPEIQKALKEYIRGFGVDEHLLELMEEMSVDKEQRLYMDWLPELQDKLKQ